MQSLSRGDLKTATYLLRKCTWEVKSQNSEERMKEQRDEENVKRATKNNLQNQKIYYALFFLRDSAHVISPA